MLEQELRDHFTKLADEPSPSAAVSIIAAERRGRTLLKRRRAALIGGPVLAVLVVLAVALTTSVLAPPRPAPRPRPPHSSAAFDPLYQGVFWVASPGPADSARRPGNYGLRERDGVQPVAQALAGHGVRGRSVHDDPPGTCLRPLPRADPRPGPRRRRAARVLGELAAGWPCAGVPVRSRRVGPTSWQLRSGDAAAREGPDGQGRRPRQRRRAPRPGQVPRSADQRAAGWHVSELALSATPGGPVGRSFMIAGRGARVTAQIAVSPLPAVPALSRRAGTGFATTSSTATRSLSVISGLRPPTCCAPGMLTVSP